MHVWPHNLEPVLQVSGKIKIKHAKNVREPMMLINHNIVHYVSVQLSVIAYNASKDTLWIMNNIDVLLAHRIAMFAYHLMTANNVPQVTISKNPEMHNNN